ncbi:unnamed protein product [Sphagnum troendelagicum]|uniref:Uncharacterized protein n=1 Tax=Sphagnum troendelagicum TaxID=128251 RepID=A0ABP0TBQ5_9BRYO
MLKALQVYPETEKDDNLLHAANASRSPVPRWSRPSARSSDDKDSRCGLSRIPNPPPPPPLSTDNFLSGVASFQQPSIPMPETPPVQGFTSQELSCSEYSHKSSLGWQRQQQLLGDSHEFAEPEPSAVAAKLNKTALVGGQQEEQTLEELLSSMGVSLTLDQENLDFSYALEYRAPPPTTMHHDDGGTGFGTMAMADNNALIDSHPVLMRYVF